MPQQNPMLEHLRPKGQRNLLQNAPLSIRYHRAHDILLEQQCFRNSYHRHRFVNLLLIHNQQLLPPPRVRIMLYLFLLVPASKHPVTRMRPTHILHILIMHIIIMDTQDITILLIHILLHHHILTTRTRAIIQHQRKRLLLLRLRQARRTTIQSLIFRPKAND